MPCFVSIDCLLCTDTLPSYQICDISFVFVLLSFTNLDGGGITDGTASIKRSINKSCTAKQVANNNTQQQDTSNINHTMKQDTSSSAALGSRIGRAGGSCSVFPTFDRLSGNMSNNCNSLSGGEENTYDPFKHYCTSKAFDLSAKKKYSTLKIARPRSSKLLLRREDSEGDVSRRAGGALRSFKSVSHISPSPQPPALQKKVKRLYQPQNRWHAGAMRLHNESLSSESQDEYGVNINSRRSSLRRRRGNTMSTTNSCSNILSSVITATAVGSRGGVYHNLSDDTSNQYYSMMTDSTVCSPISRSERGDVNSVDLSNNATNVSPNPGWPGILQRSRMPSPTSKAQRRVTVDFSGLSDNSQQTYSESHGHQPSDERRDVSSVFSASKRLVLEGSQFKLPTSLDNSFDENESYTETFTRKLKSFRSNRNLQLESLESGKNESDFKTTADLIEAAFNISTHTYGTSNSRENDSNKGLTSCMQSRNASPLASAQQQSTLSACSNALVSSSQLCYDTKHEQRWSEEAKRNSETSSFSTIAQPGESLCSSEHPDTIYVDMQPIDETLVASGEDCGYSKIFPAKFESSSPTAKIETMLPIDPIGNIFFTSSKSNSAIAREDSEIILPLDTDGEDIPFPPPPPIAIEGSESSAIGHALPCSGIYREEANETSSTICASINSHSELTNVGT